MSNVFVAATDGTRTDGTRTDRTRRDARVETAAETEATGVGRV